ncbi:MAG: hypothetical protein LBJ21_09600 [Acidobacteriota bacterium]|nr:hypothetical protein [Acidobacteriota bacterium]
MQHTREIAALQESTKAAHKRIDNNGRMIEGVHELAANVKTLAFQVETLTKTLETHVARLEAGQKSQGERIGKLEAEPASKWQKLSWLVIAGVATAIVAYFMGKLL